MARTLLNLLHLLCLLLSSAAMAHNGHLAVARPMAGIAIDGDLSDWPVDRARYPILLPNAFLHRPTGEDDYTGTLSLGYNEGSNCLYLAVEVRDESTVTDPSATAWDAQDGCEVYVDLQHRQKASPAVYYEVRGDERGMLLAGFVRTSWRGAQVGVDRSGAGHRYEWRIDVGPLSDGQVRLRQGMALGLDVAIRDRDEDGTFSWIAWGPGGVKVNSVDARGDVLLAGPEDLGEVGIAVHGDSEQVSVARTRVAIEAAASAALWHARTDRSGVRAVRLPLGRYVARAPDLGIEADVHVLAGGAHPVTFAAPRSAPERQRLGSGRGNWQTYGVLDGLATPMWGPMLEGRDGHLWFGSVGGGVARYDGDRFVTLSSRDGLVADRPEAIFEDRAGNLWFGARGGVSRYDGASFTNFTAEAGLAGSVVALIHQDRDGHMWFGMVAGQVVGYDGALFTTVTKEAFLRRLWGERAGRPTAVGSGSRIAEDRRGHLWWATVEGVHRFDGHEYRTFTEADGLVNRLAWCIALDAAGDPWIGTVGGLSHFDGARFTNYTVEDGLPANEINSILRDRLGNLWFGTGLVDDHGRGVGRWDGSSFTTCTTEDGLAHDGARVELEDREGNLWFGSVAGLSRYEPGRVTTYTERDGLSGRAVSALAMGREGDLWFATGVEAVPGMSWMGWREAGQEKLHQLRGDTLVTYTARQGLPDDVILCSLADRDGNLWFGTRDGLSRYDGSRFVSYTTADGLPGNTVVSSLEARDGALWFGTHAGACRFDGARFRAFTREDGLPSNRVLALLEDHQGHVWLGTPAGASRFDGASFETFTTQQGLGSNYVMSLAGDADGGVWLGTRDGASRYDGERFATYTTRDGLTADHVTAMLTDSRGVLWLGTDGGGVNRFDGSVFQSLLQDDGLADNRVTDLLEDHRGDVWIATRGGLTRHRSEDTPPLVRVTDVQTTRRLGPVRQVSLSTRSAVAFEFLGMSYKTRPERVVYSYRMEGYDQGWQQARARRVEYADLPRGEYAFEVKAIDRDLSASTQPARVAVTVHPPYGMLSLAGGLALSAVALAGASAVAVRRRRERDHALVERSRVLEERNQQLQEMDRLKSDFVSNVSHELRTPLTAMRSSVDNLIDGIPGAVNEKQRRYLDGIRSDARRLGRLIDDLLDLSRIEAGRMKIRPIAVDVVMVSRNVLDSVESEAREQGVTLRLERDEAAMTVWADPDRVHQILLNLVDNAIKFSPRANEVVLWAAAQGDFVCMSVRDCGQGVPDGEVEAIFEKFHQADGASGNHPGAGIGLSIARRLVELHGGRIWVESGPDKGSVFRFTLPAAQ